MIPYERQKKIIELLEDQELLKFDELKEQFDNVSESTLRRDLKALESKNKIEYLSGGAIKRRTAVGEIPIETRTAFNSKEKIKIGEIASKLIEDDDVIYLDSGSTCTELFKNILDKDITIYTTNTDILSVRGKVTPKIILLAGEFNAVNSSVSGSFTEEIISNLYFSKSFLGANGIDEEYGITTPTAAEARKKNLVRQHSDEVFLLCDSSKYHKISHVKTFDLENIVVVSDKIDNNINKLVKIITS